ncbi:MAG TPA: CheR family methyltransferase [Planctomycetota bacterium]|nr:CheR family methyltransferase [Planctomycetota bacterium]
MSVALSREAIEQFQGWLGRHLGLQFEADKIDWLGDILRGRLDQTHCSLWDEYRMRWEANAEFRNAERRQLAELLTVGETFFFRNNDHYRALIELVLPLRAQALPAPQPLRILSAGCATGEEPYTIAILTREHPAALGGRPVTIAAVDLNPRSLAKAALGRYTPWALRQTPPEIQRRYFAPAGNDFQLQPEIRTLVDFTEVNLADPDPGLWRRDSFDVIFCRNVLMYFTPASMRAAMDRLAAALAPGGFLFLGHAETMRGLSSEFHLCGTHDTFYYQRKQPGAPADPRLAEPLRPSLIRGSSSAAVAPAAPSANTSNQPNPANPANPEWAAAIDEATNRIKTLAGASAVREAAAAATMTSPRSPSTGAASSAPTRRSRPGSNAVAMELLREDRFEEALALLRENADSEPADADTKLLLAVTLINAGRLAEGEQACRALLVQDDLNAGGHYLLALCHEQRAEISAAIKHNETAVYLDPTFAMPQLHLGLIARRCGDRDTAVRALQAAQLLLAREDASRILLFGGGFRREALAELCAVELRALGGGA